MRFQCNTCGGTYDDVGADGVPYCHVCPPFVELRDSEGELLTPKQAAALTAKGKPVTRVEAQRPFHRDENIDIEKARESSAGVAAGRPPKTGDDLIKAPGAGAREMPRA